MDRQLRYLNCIYWKIKIDIKDSCRKIKLYLVFVDLLKLLETASIINKLITPFD